MLEAKLEARVIEKRRQARALYGWEIVVLHVLAVANALTIVGLPFAIFAWVFIWVRHPKRFRVWVEPIDYWKEAERAEDLGLFESARMWREEAIHRQTGSS